MSDPRTVHRPDDYRAVALAAAFVKHDHEGDEEGLQAVMDEVVRADMLGDFVRGLSGLALGFARQLGDRLPAELQSMALRLQCKAYPDLHPHRLTPGA